MALASQASQCRLPPLRGSQRVVTAPSVYTAYHQPVDLLAQRPCDCSSQRASHSSRSTVVSRASQNQDATTAATAAVLLNNDVDPDRLLAALSSTRNYTQLAAFVKSQQKVFLHSPLCVYALLHAVQLRDTISDGRINKEDLAGEAQVLKEFELVEKLLDQLCEAAVQHLPDLPITTQATLALALAQLDYYDEATYAAIAASVLQQTADRVQPSGASAAEFVPARSSALSELPEGLVSGVLLSLAVAFSISGHYNEALMNEVADQVVAFKDTFKDQTQFISIAAALLDLQHYSPELLQTAAAAAAAAVSGADREAQQSINADAVVSMLLALGFFKVQAPKFVEVAVKGFAGGEYDILEYLDPLQLSRLWKALVLLRSSSGLEPPQELVQVYIAAAQKQPDLVTLGRAKAAIRLDELQNIQNSANNVIIQEWEEAGLLAPVQILQEYKTMGYEIKEDVKVPVPGFVCGNAQQQQQQQQQQLEAIVDVCLKLPNGQRVAVLVLDDDRYCYSPRNRVRGAAAVDILVLKALGSSVVPLPVTEWQMLGGDAGKQQKYLQARLAAATAQS